MITIEQQLEIKQLLKKLETLGIEGRVNFHFKTSEFFAEIHNTQFFTSDTKDLLSKANVIVDSIRKTKWRLSVPPAELRQLEDILFEMKKIPRVDFSDKSVEHKWFFIALDNHTVFSLGRYSKSEFLNVKSKLLEYVKAWYILNGVNGTSAAYDSLAVSGTGSSVDMFHFANRPWNELEGPVTEYINSIEYSDAE